MGIDQDRKYTWHPPKGWEAPFYTFTLQATVTTANGRPQKIATTFALTHHVATNYADRNRMIQYKMGELNRWAEEFGYTVPTFPERRYSLTFHFPKERGGGSEHLWDEW